MSKQKKFDQLNILGVTVDAVSIAQGIDYICELAGKGRPSAYVVKPYVEFVDKAYKNSDIRDLLNNADLAVPDGVAITWAAAFLYAGPRKFWRFVRTLIQIVSDPKELEWPIPERAAGINFSLPLIEAATHKHLKVFLIGNPKNGLGIGHTADFLTGNYPGLHIVGTHSGRDPKSRPGRVSDDWRGQVLISVQNAKPDLILIGMGFPLQEEVSRWLAGHTEHGVYIGEGGTFDFEQFGGSLPKAPDWAVRSGLEWLWRLGKEPTRIVRQLAIPRFIFRIWRSR